MEDDEGAAAADGADGAATPGSRGEGAAAAGEANGTADGEEENREYTYKEVSV